MATGSFPFNQFNSDEAVPLLIFFLRRGNQNILSTSNQTDRIKSMKCWKFISTKDQQNNRTQKQWLQLGLCMNTVDNFQQKF